VLLYHTRDGENTMRAGPSLLSLLLAVGLLVGAVGCSAQRAEKPARSLENIPLEPYQAELLEIAFDAASAMPVHPHVENRSRTQETVVKACLELEQPLRALRYIEQIDNWRRGAGYADLAFYCAQHGFPTKAASYIELAARTSQEAEDWRKDRIKIKISETYTYMGQTEAAAQFERGVGASELGKVNRVKAMICPADSFDAEIAALERLVSVRHFDILKGALAAYAELFNRFYADPKRRALVEERMRASWGSMPVSIRIDLLADLADFSLAHADQAKAVELVDEAETLIDAASWQPRLVIPVLAGLTELRFRAGDTERARTELQDVLSLFDAKRERIVNIYRAETLCSIAEAFRAMGGTAVALDLYGRAIEAGIENPNSRPRADDLAATCCSMALHRVEPDAELMSRIRQIRDGLGDPW